MIFLIGLEHTNKQKYIIPNNKASTIWSNDMNEPYPRTIIYQTGNQPEYYLNSLDLNTIHVKITNDENELLLDNNNQNIRKVILNLEIEIL